MIRSPSKIPAAFAGAPSNTLPILEVNIGWPIKKTEEKRAKAKNAFMKGPANTTRNFWPKFFELNSQGSPLDSSGFSPANFTKPPSGKSDTQNSVGPNFLPKITGPNPMENLSTRIPTAMAIMKCPNSCTITSAPSTTINTNALDIVSSFPQPPSDGWIEFGQDWG